MNKRSDVRSKLARTEQPADAARCPKTYTLRQSFGVSYPKGMTLRCERPANAHRVHQSGAVQF